MRATPPPLTSTSYAVLGLLSVRSWTAYELAQQVERSLGWFWPRTPRKIYDEAKKLVAAGLAESADEPTGKRPRTVYSISEAGRASLGEWLGEPSADTKFEAEAVVKAFFAESGTLEQLRATLTAAAQTAEDQRSILASMFDAMGAADYGFAPRRHVNALALRHGFDQLDAQARWARWALTQIESWTSTADPGDWDWRSAGT